MFSEDEEDFLIEYEILFNVLIELWDGNEDLWSFRGVEVLFMDVVIFFDGEFKVVDDIEFLII